MSTKVVFDVATGRSSEVEMTGDELAAHEAGNARAVEIDTAARAAVQDVATRRAGVVADLQALRDATTLAAIRGPLLRTLAFILRRLGERDQ